MNPHTYFRQAATAQIVLDPLTDRVICANQEACRLWRRDITQLEGQRASELFAPNFPGLVVFSQELLEKGRGWCDHLLINTGESDLRLEVAGRSNRAGDDWHLFLSLQVADEMNDERQHSAAQRHYLSGIGHWNRVSQVFQEFERENQLLLDAAGEGIYGVDADGITTFVNPAAQRILGYSAEELAGRNMHSMVHYHHADGSHYSAHECPIFAAFKDGTVHEVDDDVFWRKDGTPIDVEYTSTPIRDNGFIVGAVVIFRDVSQKKADRRKLLETMAEVQQLKHRLELENAYLQEEIKAEYNYRHIVGRSAAVQQIVQQIQLVAPSDATVLIHGESGTGKELIARAIHDHSPRSHRSLIRVNCAAIPAELFESEFFGHSKGAFTGAHTDRTGRFELADGGTLFLDEVGEIPLHLQGKLLRVLQEQQFERVGEGRTRHVDVRILAATNKDLKSMVEAGQFREDLYYRLNVFPVESVPLRKRLEDIPLLTQHFLQKACTRANKQLLRIPLTEMEKLQQYHWPGNIRELENVIERQVILTKGGTLRFDNLNPGNLPVLPEALPPNCPHQEEVLTEAQLVELDKSNIRRALALCGGKISGPGGAAELLGIKPTTLASRVKKYHLQASAAHP